MNLHSPTSQGELPASVVAEAAAWLAVLHGPGRTQATEKGFFKWLQASPDHARAFEEATEIWEDSRNLPRGARFPRAVAAVRWKSMAVAAAAVALFVVVGFILHWQYAGVATGVGEQRVLTLKDGTQVVLNTATRVVVSYDRQARTVELKSGEALFEVAKRPAWPFIVIAGDRRIRALGTAFVVRREEDRVDVTLVEGKVTVTDASTAAPDPAVLAPPGAQLVVLSPGQRMTFDDTGVAQLDHPKLENVLAWQRREVALDDTPLSKAIAEVNRYSTRPVVLEQQQAARVHVSGLFRTGDSLSFARAVAAAYHLELVEQPHRIVLRGSPLQADGAGNPQ